MKKRNDPKTMKMRKQKKKEGLLERLDIFPSKHQRPEANENERRALSLK